MKVTLISEFWTRASVEADPNRIYIFGDNEIDKGMAGQACIRGLPNAFGIPTLKAPGKFWSDDNYHANCAAISAAIKKIPRNKEWVLSADGLGTGLADLPNKAPRTFEFLKTWIDAIYRAQGVVTAPGVITKGFKATLSDMSCRPSGALTGVTYVEGEWTEHNGPLRECSTGIHFCIFPSGVWSYYSDLGTRIFEVEAEFVLETDSDPGAALKKVCSRLKIVKERFVGAKPGEVQNSSNTGDRNTGNRNTGNRNTGDSNTGNRNTGNRNTGDRNTGDSNTGDRNTGNRNTGNRNTGDSNTGNRNTGNSNTGNSNTTDFSTGFFNQSQASIYVFDVDCGMTRREFIDAHWEQANWLSNRMLLDESITDAEFEKVSSLPGITREKLESLHAKHIAGRVAAGAK